MVMTEQEQPNKDIRTRKRLRPYLGQALTFVGYLDKVVYKGNDSWCMLVDCYDKDNQLEVDHVHVPLSKSSYERMKPNEHKMVSFEGTIKKYLARVKPALDGVNDKVNIITKEKRYGIDKVTNIDTGCSALKIDYNLSYRDKLTEYEQFTLNNLREQMQEINDGSYKLTAIKELSEDFIRENQDIGKRNSLLNNTQTCIDNKDFESFPDIFIDEITQISTIYPSMLPLLEEKDKEVSELKDKLNKKSQELTLKNGLLKDKDKELNAYRNSINPSDKDYNDLLEDKLRYQTLANRYHRELSALQSKESTKGISYDLPLIYGISNLKRVLVNDIFLGFRKATKPIVITVDEESSNMLYDLKQKVFDKFED